MTAGSDGTPLSVLVVEDDPADAELNLVALREGGFDVQARVASTAEAFERHLDEAAFDVVLSDYRLRGWTGVEALRLLRSRGADVPFILVTGTLGDEKAIECIKEGAVDYVVKSHLGRLPIAVRHALAEQAARRERARAEDQIRLLSLALDQSPASVIITDSQGTIQYVNRRFTEVTGYTIAEAVEHSPRLLRSGLTPREVYADMWKTIRAGGIWRGEIQNRRKSGEVYLDTVTISPLRNESGQVTHFLATQEDITERRAAQRALAEREKRFRQLADNISEVFFIQNTDFSELLYINPAYERIWGRSRESLYENPASFLEAILPEDRHLLAESVAKAREGREPERDEFRVVRPDGSVRWVLAHAVPIRNEAGEVYRIAGFALDITERREAEEGLRESERKMRTLFETVNLIVMMLDAQGNLEYANPYLLQLTGYARDEVLGRSWFDHFLPDAAQDEMREAFGDLLHREQHLHYRNPITTRAGEERMISWHNTVLKDADDRPIGTLSVGEDVTDYAQLETQLRQAQKMEAIGRLAGGVAHDFNNLLTVITSYAEILLEDLGADSPMRDDVVQILRAGEGAASLTKQLLAFSRQQVIAPRVVQLEDVVAGAEKLLRRVLGEDVTLVTALNPSRSNVLIDPGQLEQVIMNLAVNARDAMPAGGSLSIETSRVDLADDYVRTHGPVRPGRYALMAMSDNGMGMNARTLERVFEPFFTTKEVGKGTGLGLATVYGIVKQSNGYVWIYSEAGQGTTVKVYLPVVEEDVESRPVASEAIAPQGGSETILLVEDAPAVRAIARQILERFGYEVLEAPSPAVALDIAARRGAEIDLLLTDVVMPEMSGRELAEAFIAVCPSARVLYMSGYTDDSVVRHGVLAPGAAYLQKPFSPATLARAVRDALEVR